MAGSGSKLSFRKVGAHNFPEYTPLLENHLHRITTIMGTTKSGKTIMAKNIIKCVAPEISIPILISETESVNMNFAKIVERPCIHEELTPEVLENILNRQKNVIPLWRAANRIDVLHELYSRHPLPEIDGRLNSIRSTMAELKMRAEAIKDPGVRKSRMDDINETEMECKINEYKAGLRKNRHLYAKEKMSKEESVTWAYFDFNPNLLLIIDDCSDMFSKQKIKAILRAILYKSRHFRMTTIIMCQNESDMIPALRSNSHVTIFTSPDVAAAFFYKSKLPPEIKNRYMNMATSEFFKDHKKMVYLKDEPDHRIWSYKGELIYTVKIGSRYYHRMCEKVKSDEYAIDESNPYYQDFMANIE